MLSCCCVEIKTFKNIPVQAVQAGSPKAACRNFSGSPKATCRNFPVALKPLVAIFR
jgi:hypothetical protein